MVTCRPYRVIFVRGQFNGIVTEPFNAHSGEGDHLIRSMATRAARWRNWRRWMQIWISVFVVAVKLEVEPVRGAE